MPQQPEAAWTWPAWLGAASFSAVIASGLVTGADVALTLWRAGGVGGETVAEFLAFSLALYFIPTWLGGLVLASALASADSLVWPSLRRGAIRLRADDAFDQRAVSVVMSAVVGCILLAAAAAALSMQLVGGVERKGTGAIFLGVLIVACVPAVALLSLPVYSMTRRVVGLVPRPAGIPRTIAATTGILLLAAASLIYLVATRLDWRSLPWHAIGALVGLATLATSLLLFLRWRRTFQPSSALSFGVGLVLMASAATGLVEIAPHGPTISLLSVQANGAPVLLDIARGILDHDGDGYAAVLGGGDCNDDNDRQHPGAIEVPDNGIDDNCRGGDAVSSSAQRQSANTTATESGQPVSRRIAGNLLFIVIDTVRADRLGMAGYRRNNQSLTPHIDALARESAYFTRAYAQAPNTPRSFPSFFTSRYPSKIAWEDGPRNYPRVLPENTTMFEVFASEGLHTAAVASHFYFGEDRGIEQGFADFDNHGAKSIADSNRDVAGPRIVDRTRKKLNELANSKVRFALMVHLFEPHSAYVRHDEYPIKGSGRAGLVERYDYEVKAADDRVGEILAALAEAGLTDSTAIVLLSDHGEAFGEHQFAGKKMDFHGQTLYDELLRVPLVIHIPGVAARVIEDRVALVDLAPTLVAVLGGPTPSSFQGRSLLPLIRGQAASKRSIFAELLPAPSWPQAAKMIISEDHKLIHWSTKNTQELYDLAGDPGEKSDLALERRDTVQQLGKQLLDFEELNL